MIFQRFNAATAGSLCFPAPVKSTLLKVLTIFAVLAAMCASAIAQTADISISARIVQGVNATPISNWYPNEEFTYEIRIDNNGPDDATSVVVETNLPDGFTPANYHGTDFDGVIDLQPFGTNFTIGRLLSGGRLTYSYPAMVASPGTYEFSSTAASATADSNSANNSAQASVVIEDRPLADIAVTLTVDEPGPYTFGQSLTFRVAVTNNGPMPAENVHFHLTGSGPGNWHFDSIETSHPLEGTAPYVIVPLLEVGESTYLKAVTSYPLPGKYLVQAGATHYSEELVDLPGNNTVLMELLVGGEVPQHSLEASMKSSPATVQPGGLLAYSMILKNNGPDDASSVTLTTLLGLDWLNHGVLTLQSIEATDGWDVQMSGNLLIGFHSGLAAGESTTVTLIARAGANVKDEIRQGVWFESFFGQRAQASVTTPVTAAGGEGVDLMITRSASSNIGILNEPITYTVKAFNLGPEPTDSAYVSSLLPANAAIASVTSDKGSPSVVGQHIEISDLPLAAGEIATMEVTVVPQETGRIHNQVGVVSPDYDPDIENNIVDLSTIVAADANCSDLAVQMDTSRVKEKVKKKTGESSFKIQAKVLVTNNGMECSPESSVKLYVSNDTTWDSSDTLIATKALKPVCAGKKAKKVNLKAKLSGGVDPRGRYLIAVVDADGSINECDEENNTAVNN